MEEEVKLLNLFFSNEVEKNLKMYKFNDYSLDPYLNKENIINNINNPFYEHLLFDSYVHSENGNNFQNSLL